MRGVAGPLQFNDSQYSLLMCCLCVPTSLSQCINTQLFLCNVFPSMGSDNDLIFLSSLSISLENKFLASF